MYVVSISLIIGLLLSFFILFISYKSVYRQQLSVSSSLLHNAQSGINLLCADKSIARYEPKTLDLFGTGKDSVTLWYKPWGVFDVLVSEAFFKGRRERLVALSASGIDPQQKVALYLADLDRPASVSGNTLLKGTCYIPKSGIKPAFVEGSSFTGTKIIEGDAKTATTQIPAPDQNWLDNLAGLSRRNFTSASVEKGLLPTDSLRQSFTKNTLLVEQQGDMIVDNITIRGNVILSSNKKIIIGAHAVLKDLLVVAPYIKVEEGFSGSVHLVATDTIITGKKVTFRYPSSLVVINDKLNSTTPYLLLDEDSRLNGLMMVWKGKPDAQYQPKLVLSKHTYVKGQLLCNGYTGLNTCKIDGSVYTNKMLLLTGSSVYENHLLNTQIDATKLPDNFCGLFFENKHYLNGVAAWLY